MFFVLFFTFKMYHELSLLGKLLIPQQKNEKKIFGFYCVKIGCAFWQQSKLKLQVCHFFLSWMTLKVSFHQNRYMEYLEH